jgi:membrane dipeptidase
VARYVDEFDYLKRLVGVDYIGFGTMPPEMMYKQSPSIRYVDGFESVSDIGNVRAEMERRGYTPEEIAKIFGGNWMRVFREAWND